MTDGPNHPNGRVRDDPGTHGSRSGPVLQIVMTVCSAFVTAQRKVGRSTGLRKMMAPMNYPEGHQSSIEARRFPRYEIDAEIHVAMFGRAKQEVMRGRALNISETGVAGLFVTGWDAGTTVNLKFSVPVVSNPLSVDAVVRSRSDYRYGFEFVELNPVQREIIGKTCRTLALLQ